MTPTIGKKAPDFTLPSSEGMVTLKQFKSKKIVLYFYPQDDTPTCTQQACDFRDNMERLTALGCVIIGISPDSIKDHNKFIRKYNLNYILLSDEEHKVTEQYGAWGEKTLFGRTYMGVIRSTFIINEKGVLTHIFTNVRLKGHIDTIAHALS